MNLLGKAGLALALLATGLFASPMADAQTYFENAAGLSSPAQTFRLADHVLPDATVVTNQWAAYGMTFTGAEYNPYRIAAPGTPASSPYEIGNFDQAAPYTPDTLSYLNTDRSLHIFFAAPLTGAALLLDDSRLLQYAPGSVQAFLNGVAVQPAAALSLNDNNTYVGFTGAAFDELRLYGNHGGDNYASDDTLFVKSIQLGSPAPALTPEGPSGLLLACALVPVIGTLRRRRGGPGRRSATAGECLS